MLTIKALGNLSIIKDGEILDQFGSTKAETILAYLALESGQHSRNALAALFWPESSEGKAHASLRVALSSLRKHVGEYLKIDRETVEIKAGADVSLDVQEFETKLAEGNLSQALELYRGDLLRGISIQDSTVFENWRRWEGERLHLLVINALEESIAAELARGCFQKGQGLALELLKLDPLHEAAHQQFMAALALGGNRTEALNHYQACHQMLQENLGVDPASETKKIKDLISQDDRKALSQMVQPENNLPNPKTSFVGREDETVQIVNLISDERCRLLTLTGPGGAGKTRLALQTARKVLRSYTDGLFFISLEKVPSYEFLVSAIAEALKFEFDQHTLLSDSRNQLIDYLENRNTLLVLDGFEHLSEGGKLLSDILQRSAQVKLLVTSRQTVNIQGEWLFTVCGLPIPEDGYAVGAEGGSALDLFIERALQANPTFSIQGEEAEAALQICQLVEGFPLAIELAAAWTATLNCVEIAKEIERSYDFLKSPYQDIAERQRSLRATFNYSWQMLEKEQQAVLARLSIFRGGFRRQAAKQIADASLATLTHLLNKSLLQRQGDGRISMHKTIQYFSEEKLKNSSKEWKTIHEKHSQYYLKFLGDRERDLENEKMVATREEIRKEIENLRAAINWAVRGKNREAVTETIRSYYAFCLVQGWHNGVITFDQLAALISKNTDKPALEDPAYLSCRVHQAWFCSNLGMVEESEAISKTCLEPLHGLDMVRERAICLHNLGLNAGFQGDYERSRKRLEEAIELGKKDPFVALPSFYLWLGYFYFLVGEYAKGMHCFQTSYESFMERGNTWGASFALSKMGLAADGLGEHAAAMTYFQEAYKIFIKTGDLTGQGYSLSRMCLGAYFLDDFEKGIHYGEQALEQFKDIGHRWGMCVSLCHLGFCNLGIRNMLDAQTLFYEALQQAVDGQFVPLSLYALAGIGSTLVLTNDRPKGVAYFRFVRSHPKTPALYVDVAGRWFGGPEEALPNGKGGEATRPTLDEIVQDALQGRKRAMERNGEIS